MSKSFVLPERFEKNEQLITDVIDQQYGMLDDFLGPDLVEALRENLVRKFETGAMHPAGIGKRFSFTRNLAVRGDCIAWIDQDTTDEAEQAFLETVTNFMRYLNESCYTGLNAFEFHYAMYEEGSFYKRHLDQFKSDQGRKFSLVSYLNDNWQAENGGQLVLYLPDQSTTILPAGGRCVFFKADEIEHEVLPANRKRMSIAGWLKRV